MGVRASGQRRASAHLLVASNTANTELRSGLSRISHVPVSNWASRPPNPCTATSTNLRSKASMICAPSSATELSGNNSSRHSDAARAAASTRFRVVSVPCSSASASRPSNASRTRMITRCGRSDGRTSRLWKITTRLLARERMASSWSCSIGRTSAVWATLILRWSILTPSCAISADSMLRTTCLACTSLEVSTWISLTSPSGVTIMRADSTPVRLENLISSLTGVLSARMIVTPLGEVSEIHVLTSSDVQAKQVVRNIESALMAQLGVKIDHRKISVAQTADVRPIEQLQEEAIRSRANKRVVIFQSLEVRPSERPQRVIIRVRLAFEGREAEAEEQGTDTTRNRVEAAARAASLCLDELLPDNSVALEGATIIDAFDRKFVLVAVHGLGGREAQLLTGTCEIRESPERSSVLAVLDATNRWADARR